MRRGTILGATVAGVLLLAGATGFAASAFAAGTAAGDAPATSTVTQEQVDPDSSDCPFVGGDTDAMRSHMDGLHGAGSFDAMWPLMAAAHGSGSFEAMHAPSGGMMSSWTGR